ncbi:hypothetical protein E2C01_026735 [Portunus trituberculatus]|uniref:Uncharacterized protein n=1 Tax=Portunus trituberculatus TaxID=210409 RepID=A0A5B7EJK9_PORTR|nr:hypothetical protein [Portunus trituberculatus]
MNVTVSTSRSRRLDLRTYSEMFYSSSTTILTTTATITTSQPPATPPTQPALSQPPPGDEHVRPRHKSRENNKREGGWLLYKVNSSPEMPQVSARLERGRGVTSYLSCSPPPQVIPCPAPPCSALLCSSLPPVIPPPPRDPPFVYRPHPLLSFPSLPRHSPSSPASSLAALSCLAQPRPPGKPPAASHVPLPPSTSHKHALL